MKSCTAPEVEHDSPEWAAPWRSRRSLLKMPLIFRFHMLNCWGGVPHLHCWSQLIWTINTSRPYFPSWKSRKEMGWVWKNLHTPGITWAVVFFSLGPAVFLFPNAWCARAKNCLKMKVGNLGRTHGSLKGLLVQVEKQTNPGKYFFSGQFIRRISGQME